MSDESQEIETTPTLRLFVWPEFAQDYKDGLAFAVAEDVYHARSLVIDAAGWDPADWGPMQVFSLAEPRAFCVTGGM